MWIFNFEIDYTMMDKRVITHEHQVKINEPELETEQMAWDWVKDTFPYEDFDDLSSVQVRFLNYQKINNGF